MRRGELAVNVGFQLLPLFYLGAMASAIVAYHAPFSMAVLGGGFLLFLKAKISVVQQGKFVTFGLSQMGSFNRICYIVGYCLMAMGVSFLLAR